MNNYEVSFTSLCYVEEDSVGHIWLHRFADIENGILNSPFKSDRYDNFFENRDRLYYSDGPNTIGAVGVWNWNAIPNRNNPATDYVQTFYAQECSPVRVVVSSANSLEMVVEQLRNGTLSTQTYVCDTLFCYEPKWGKLHGVLCKANEFTIQNKAAKLMDGIYSLPVYSFGVVDVYNWEDRNLRFLKELKIGNPSDFISFGDTDEIVRSMIIGRFTKRKFKEVIGTTINDWRNCKIVLESVCDESLYDEVSNRTNCSPEQARKYVDDFVTRVNGSIDAGNIDADVLAKIAINHDVLRQKCEETVFQRWYEAHTAEIAEAEQEVASIRSTGERERENARNRLSEIEKDIASAEEKKNSILSEIEAAQTRLKQQCDEIERNKTIGNNTVDAIRRKIADAQKDVAGFISDISMFLPQNSTISTNQASCWKYNCAESGVHSDDDYEITETWKDEFERINHNLSTALNIEGSLCNMLSAFLYSTHINNMPIFVAGPGGQEIADIMAVSIFGKGAGQLTLGSECDLFVSESIKNCDEQVVAIRNMFGRGWSDILPQSFCKLDKQIVWTHPFAEDMLIESRGLYNYMLPVLSECFVKDNRDGDLIPGKRSEGFRPFSPPRSYRLKIAPTVKKLGFSNFFMNRFVKVLSDAKSIINEPRLDIDLEFLLGLLPLTVLTGKTDILREAVEADKSISRDVKAELERYIGEE